VLDGEVAVFDKELVSRFHLLGDDDTGILCTPPIYIGFDVLQLGRRDLRGLPLAERRVFLEDHLDGHTMVLPCRRLPDYGAKAWAIVEERGYEGMIAKDPRSTYRSGSTRSWMKVKVRHEGVFVVGGIRDVNAFDGVLVGERVGGTLHYRGVVEWGFKAPDVLALLEHARRWSRPSAPFVDTPRMRSVTWVEPRLEAEVSYAEIVEGRLRAPSWRGMNLTTKA
jgi:bifunctional non-homologous end joining protein LigD